MVARSQAQYGKIEPDGGTGHRMLMSGTPLMVAVIVLVALLFLVGVRKGFAGFIPSFS